MQWRGIPLARWGLLITSVGIGNRKPEFLLVCVPGCPTLPDNLMETLLYLLYQAAGRSPMIPLDHALRPTWLFGQTVHEGCDRGGYYEQAEFAEEYGLLWLPKCTLKSSKTRSWLETKCTARARYSGSIRSTSLMKES